MRLLISSLLFVVFLGLVIYRPGAEGMDGGELFFAKCGSCHKEGGVAPVIAPVKFAGVQWERFFDKNKHIRKKDISDKFTDEEIASIKKYLIDHAADSDRPIVAGVR